MRVMKRGEISSAHPPGEISPPKIKNRQKGQRSRKKAVRAAVAFIVFALVWEAIGRFWLTSAFEFAPLSTVLVEAVRQLGHRAIWQDTEVSFLELWWGFFASAILGVGAGILLGTSERARDYFSPLVFAIYATPVIALAPLFIMLLGIGMLSKVVVIFLLCYFPIMINTAAGIQSTDPVLIEAAVAFGASHKEVVQKVLLPQSVSYIVAGLRVALGRGFVGIVVAELYGATAGLGWLIWQSSEQMNTKKLFVAVLILAVAGIVSTYLLNYMEKRLAPWREFHQI